MNSHSILPQNCNFQILSTIAFALVLVAVFLTPFSGLGLRAGAIKLVDIPFIASFMLTFLYCLLSGRAFWTPVKLLLAALITISGFLLAILLEDAEDSRKVAAFMMIISWFLIPLVLMNQIQGEYFVRFKLMLSFWLAGGILAALIGILQNEGIISLRAMAGLGRINSRFREAGLTVHPNTYGFYCALLFPLCLDMIFLKSGIFRKLLACIACIILVYACNISGSRGALLLIGIAFTAVVFLHAIRIRLLLLFIIVAVIISLLLLAYGLGAVPQLGEGQSAVNRLFFGDASAERANEARVAFLIMVTSNFLDAPLLGNGYKLYGVHDALIGTLAISGIVGLVGFLLRESVPIRDCKKVLSIAWRGSYDSIPAIGMAVAYIVWLLSLATAYWMIERGGIVTIGLLASASVLISANRQSESRQAA